MTSQPRQLAGSHRSGVAEGGRFAAKPVPAINSDGFGFNTEHPAVGPVNDWTKRVVKIWGLQTTFTRTVGFDTVGNTVAVVGTDCDDPAVLLLARKGDASYWNSNIWSKNRKERRMWSAEITRQMLKEGLVATGLGADSDGIYAAMTAATSPSKPRVLDRRRGRESPHALTGVVAQIRGLRLLQSMAPAEGWATKLGGYDIPNHAETLLQSRFVSVASVYRELLRPPWVNTVPVGVPWGSQTVAGHANTRSEYNPERFVGEHSDLVWRALTETDRYGSSPLKARLRQRWELDATSKELIVAAALYDETAAEQLTTGLFDGVPTYEHRQMLKRRTELLEDALNPSEGACRWTAEQQHRIRGFVDVIEGDEAAA